MSCGWYGIVQYGAVQYVLYCIQLLYTICTVLYCTVLVEYELSTVLSVCLYHLQPCSGTVLYCSVSVRKT
jgi:hypothetical protein